MAQTDKTLALLLVAAIVISLGGTIVSLNKLGQMEIEILTGKAVDNQDGYVTLNITSETNIAYTRDTINFGNGYVNSTCDNCTMWTNTTTGGTSSNHNISCCEINWNSLDSAEASAGLWIQNQGNTNLTVELNFSDNASTFLGGSSPDPEFQYMVLADNDAKNCPGAATCTGVAADDTTDSCGGNLIYTGQWYDANTSNPTICANYGLQYDGSQDEIVLDVRLVVPRTATSTQKTATLTITGTSTA